MSSSFTVQSNAVEIKVTDDGSATLFVPHLNEHYHSVHGAQNESMHVFVRAGLQYLQHRVVHILEVGMGTGLNVWLTALSAGARTIRYHAIERFPLPAPVYEALQWSVPETDRALWLAIHRLSWESGYVLQPGFELQKMEADIHRVALGADYHLIYFDAFAPDKQPEMWSEPVLRRMFQCLVSGGVLVTYCAKGSVRRLLQQVGFCVERIPGPPPKREMLRAVKP